ncbi:hypothetical protein [Actinoallomurus sp. CA-150999]|uniref:hypothetical protein n=1 Tax=Actinoallomurus sp. CA-150999 TaxID=3239887 RepID=UPI003D94EE37
MADARREPDSDVDAKAEAVPQRMDIVLRGAAYGSLAGLATGALVGGVLGIMGGPVGMCVFAVFGGAVGAAVGLGPGIIGGTVFALAARPLTRDDSRAPLAGMAVAFGWSLVANCVGLWFTGLVGGGLILTVESLVRGLVMPLPLVHMVICVCLGALLGPSVLHGKRSPADKVSPGE